MLESSSRAVEALNLLADLLARAKRAGASAADAVLTEGVSLQASIRMGKPEDVERAEGKDLGLRVFIGRQQAFVSSTDISSQALGELTMRAVAMARAAPEDKYCGLADPDMLARTIPDLELEDGAEPDSTALLARARAAEEAALAVPGIVNSEGAGASFSRGLVALATSAGFTKAYRGSRHGFSVTAIAGDKTGMERDYDFASARYLADLGDPAAIGRGTGLRAVRRLNPRKIASQQVPVVYDPRVANSLLGHLAGAISGAAVARRTSFLQDRLGQPIFKPGIGIVDDPLRRRGLRSRPFDGEGVAGMRRHVVADGRLTTWLLDSATALQLDLSSTGHASRGTASPPHPAPSNLYLEPGMATPADLIGALERGVYVTELIGFGVNGVTGDYSRGAAGFWIENGEIAYPVSEITIAGNLKDMFLRLTPADDLVFKYGTDSPTVLVEGMTVAGI